MSLYNLLHGVNEAYPGLLKILNLNRAQIDRFRDCYIEGKCICVHTRTGGGNREDYQENIDFLRSHPLYINDSDDSFDGTYANFYFKFPDEHKELLENFAKENPATPAHEKWKDLFEKMGILEGDDNERRD